MSISGDEPKNKKKLRFPLEGRKGTRRKRKGSDVVEEDRELGANPEKELFPE